MPATPTLTAITGATASSESNGQINLNWNSVTGASSYTLERSLDGELMVRLTTTSGTSYTDTGIPSDTTYYYRVLASNSSGFSPYSAPVAAVSSLTANEHYVLALYQDFLSRNGSKAELDGWANQIPSYGLQAIANAISYSPEALDRVVNQMYLAFLGRPADSGSESYWVSQLQSGHTEEWVMSRILSSSEFYADWGSNNTGFVEGLYADVLKRSADPGGLSYWVNQLNSGVSRATIAYDLLFARPSSTEFRTDAVLALYGGGGPGYSFVPNLLERSQRGLGVTSAEINSWVNSGVGLLGMEVDFAATSEFYNLAQNN